MINLKKEEKPHKTFSFSEEDFANIRWQNIGKKKRIFIPDSELPDENEERCAFLDSLISYIEQKTGKHCSYIPINETEPYEVNGFYVQYAPELLDYDGCYVKNDSLVCDRNSRKWHVSYYYKNKTLHIILDNERGENYGENKRRRKRKIPYSACPCGGGNWSCFYSVDCSFGCGF